MKVYLLGIMLFCFVRLFATDQDTLVIGYTLAPPFIIEEEDELHGISIWLWEEVSKDIDQPYRMKRLAFQDMLKALEEGTIDGSINPLTITGDRSRKFRFTSPFYVSHSVVVTDSRHSIHKLLVILRTFFSLNFLRVLGLLLIIISLFGTLTWFFERKVNPHDFRPGLKGLWDGFWWSTVTMTTVGYGDKSPKSRGGKFVALIWMFSALIFVSGLTATLASTILKTELTETNLSLDDFKAKRVGTIASTSTEEYLRLHFFKGVTTYSDIQEALDDVKGKDLDALMYDEPILKYRLSQREDAREFETLPIRFDLQLYAFAFSNQHEDLIFDISQAMLDHTESLDWRMLLSEYDLSEL